MPLEVVDPVPGEEGRCSGAHRLSSSLHLRRCLCFRHEIELGNESWLKYFCVLIHTYFKNQSILKFRVIDFLMNIKISNQDYAPEAGRAGELDPGGLLEEGEGAFWGRCGEGGTAKLPEEVVVVVVGGWVGGCVEAAVCKMCYV